MARRYLTALALIGAAALWAGHSALAAGDLPAGSPAGATPIPRGMLAPRGVGGIKAAVAALATAWLIWGLWLERRGRGDAWRRLRDVGLALLGLAGAICWLNVFQFHYPGFGHPSDTFHYYLGAKYFPELRYTRLYECTAVADAEAGLAAVRPIRNLETNQLTTSAAILAEPDRCTRHFGPARWDAFRMDVEFLRARVPERRWLRFQQDHGYNATPTWGLAGAALTRTGAASETQLALLRAIDPLLLLATALAIGLVFGWRVACVTAIYFGTNYAAPYGWTGGSLLRYDWLAATGIGICLLRVDRPATGGALLALAALLRLFPALVLAGVALGVGGRWISTRRVSLTRFERRAALGAVATAILLAPLSGWVAGPDSWAEFTRNSRVHLSTPLANHVGLRTVMSYDPAQRSSVARDPDLSDPMEPWKRARRERFESQEAFFWALALGFGVLVARAAARQPAWVGAVLGVAWIPVAVELTGYYWSVLALLALLSVRHAAMAAAVCALAAASWGVASLWHWTDEIHVWLSVLGVAFSVFAVLLLTPRGVSGESDSSVLPSKGDL